MQLVKLRESGTSQHYRLKEGTRGDSHLDKIWTNLKVMNAKQIQRSELSGHNLLNVQLKVIGMDY
jgi:hypothetical protein